MIFSLIEECFLISGQKDLTLGGVSFWLEEGDIVYDIPSYKWDMVDLMSDITHWIIRDDTCN